VAHWILVISGLYVLLGGISSFAGWVFDVQPLTDWYGNGISIQPNATLCVSLSGLALLGLAAQRKHIARYAGASVLLIGGATLLQWIGGISLGIDDLLMFSREWGRVGVVIPGRMGPPGSFSWTLIGAALVLTTASSVRLRHVASGLCVVTVALSLLALTGYFYDVSALFANPHTTVIALQTATFVAASSIGILACHPDSEPMLTLRDPGSAGRIARRALPVILLVPIGLGFLRVQAERASLVDPTLGAALLVLAMICVLSILVGWALHAVRKTEHQLRHERDFLERLIEFSPVAIAVVRGPELSYIMLNPAYRAIAGSSMNPAIGRTYPDVFPEAAAQGAAEQIRQVIATGTAWQVRDFKMPIGDRTETWWEGEVLPLPKADGTRDSALLLTWEISDRKRAERELREADRRKDEFLAILAHELRNPLAPISVAAQVLRLKGASALPWAQEIFERQTRHMARLIDDLMNVNRISQGKLELHRAPVQLATIFEVAVEACRPLIDESRHELTIVLPEQPIFVDADLTRLAQVFTNLFNNACRYMDPGGRIRVAAEPRGAQVLVTVQDSGIGIPADKFTAIFELFAQVDPLLPKSRSGLGVGLSLARRLVELHGGRIDVHSEGLGKGSTFSVSLPVVLTVPANDGGKAEPKPEPADPVPAASRRVLVVDDNRDAADSLTLMLGSMGHDVRTAYDGAEAIRIAGEYLPDIVMLDIGLPGVNGHDAARTIRETPWGKRTVLIAVTGWGQDADRIRTRDSGFDHHLVKPVSPEAIRELVASARGA
jgi:PAS domain S-box-containing protein